MFPNKKESVGVALGLFIVQIAIAFFLSYLGLRWRAGDPIIYIVITATSTAVIIYFSLTKMELRLNQLFHAYTNNLSQLLALILLPLLLTGIGFQILFSNFLNFYYTLFPNINPVTENLDALLKSGLLGFLSIVLVAPVAEEMIFRGVILRGLLSNYSQKEAILTSSILFSLFHLNPEQLLPTLVVGYFFGWLYVQSYSLWPSISAHVLFNLIAFFLESNVFNIKGINDYPEGVIIYPSLAVQILGLAGVLAIWFLLFTLSI